MLAEGKFDGPSSDKREKKKTDRNICFFFNSKKGCKFAENCKFKHEVLNPNREEGCATEKVTGTLSDTSDQAQQYDKPVLSKEPSEGVPSKSTDEGEELKTEEPKENQKICHHYLRVGWCRFGKRCRFLHPKKERGKGQAVKQPIKIVPLKHQEDHTKDELHVQELTENNRSSQNEQLVSKCERRSDKKKQLCKFYLSGNCRFGSNCNYLHNGNPYESESSDVGRREDEIQPPVNPKPSVRGQRYSGYHTAQGNPSKPTKRRCDLTDEDVKALNKTECDQLKKRFSQEKLEILSETEDECCYKLQFVPTDPDWPFDIREFLLKILIPAQYPLQMFVVELPDDDVVPESVGRYIEERVCGWLEEKQESLEKLEKAELVFRPFLRWFDRNLENIVTEGLRRYQRELAAKAAGFEFIPAKEPCQTIEDDPSLFDGVNEQKDSRDSDDSNDTGWETDESSENDDDNQSKNKMLNDYSNVERKGTEILLRHLQLKDQAATLAFEKLAIVIQCIRCKSTAELCTPAGRLNSIPCAKCNSEQRLVYRPAMAHHFSAVIGYLDLAECSPFDLILQDSVGTVSCINCSRDMKLEGFLPGQMKQTWCQRCHQKLSIAVDSVRFQQLQPSDWNNQGLVHQVQVSRVRRLPKDPAIQEGKPLPAEGTCKHYKKSFRWLRFPCCGKCYPCDICHDDKEGDHEMKYATRMICGFCCKEQPYSVEKPCVLCGSQLTKTRSSYWEGGRGCRDKIRMSRNDVQKYANMSKTISKKAQEKLESKKSGKKTTKLRHT